MSPRRIVLTGASSGIGRALALGLAAQGDDLDLLGRDQDRLSEVAARVVAAGGGAETHAFDLLDDSAVVGFARRRAEEWVDVLVHCAGAVELGPVATAPVAHLDLQYRLNLRAPFLLTQLLLPALERSRGQVVFINSGAGHNARAQWSQYAASKFGLRALADSLRAEVAGAGVRVSSVYPGRTASPMQQKVRDQEGEPYSPDSYLSPEGVAAQVVALLDLDPPATVTDLSIRPS